MSDDCYRAFAGACAYRGTDHHLCGKRAFHRDDVHECDCGARSDQ